MAAARLRQAFKYPSEDDDDDIGVEELDEEHQEKLISDLQVEDAQRNELYRKLFLAIPLLGTLFFLYTFLMASTARQRLIEIRDQVRRILEADREADDVRPRNSAGVVEEHATVRRFEHDAAAMSYREERRPQFVRVRLERCEGGIEHNSRGALVLIGANSELWRCD